MRTTSSVASIAASLLFSGCLTFSGSELPEIAVEPRTTRPVVHHTIGDFAFELDGGELATAGQVGQEINEKILERWADSGLISDHRFIRSSRFTDSPALRLTLSGKQHGESSVALQVLSGLTLLAIPHYVDSNMSLHYSLENPDTGCVFEASATESYNTVIGLLLIPALPFSQLGSGRSYDLIADHVYSQLAAQRAFDEHPPCEDAPLEISLEAHSRALEEKLAAGLISQSEYEARSQEPYFVTAEAEDPACSLLLVSSDAHSDARFDFRVSEARMVAAVVRCATTSASVSIQAADVGICADGRWVRTLGAEAAIERARAPEGLPLGLVGGFYAGVTRARNQDVEARFRAGHHGVTKLEPGQDAEGFVFFDAPEGALPRVSGAMLVVRDVDTGESRTLHLGDTLLCSSD